MKTEEEQPATPQVGSVWTRQPRRQKEQLSRERIVAEALVLLDAEGLEALSMRTLGQRLGAGATSLYRHVANKDELIELLVDEIYAEIDVPEAEDGADWRDIARVMFRSLRAAGLRHMWMTHVLGQTGMNYLGPNVMDVTSRSLRVFTQAGFEPAEAQKALSTLSAYVIGITAAEAGWLMALRRNGLNERDWLQIVKPSMDKALAEGYEDLGVYMDQFERDAQQVREENFEYGLDRVIDGLQLRLDAVRGGRA